MKWLKSIIILLIIILFFGLNIETEKQQINRIIENNEISYDIVEATMYTVDPKQTDMTPLITASGFKIDSLYPEKQRIIAISRDLKKKYKFGTKVMVKGTGKWDGIYTVNDVMNKRWRKKIDILVNPKFGYNSFTGVKIYPIARSKD